jgi:hypothetical protein
LTPEFWFPFLPPQFPTVGIFERSLDNVPPLCWVASLTFRAYALDAGNGPVWSNEVVW